MYELVCIQSTDKIVATLCKVGWQQDSGKSHIELLVYQFAVVMMYMGNVTRGTFDSSPAEVNQRNPV